MGFAEAFAYTAPAEIFSEHAALSAFENAGRRDFDIGAHAGIAQHAYDALAPFQWPQPAGQARGETRFFADGGFYHAGGKARLVAIEPVESDRTDAEYPFTLNTGRIRDQWHTMTRTGKSARLSSHIAEPFAELHPRDALEIGVGSAELVEIKSPQGSAVMRALITERQARGSIFAPMHWNDQFAARARIDTVVPAITDRFSGQPASKNVAVAARRFRAQHYAFAVSHTKPVELDAAYWALARADGGWRLELAFTTPVEAWTDWCRRTLVIPADVEPLGYSDAQTGDVRLAFFDGTQLLAAIFLAHEPVAVARNWAIAQLTAEHANLRKRFALVAGRPGADKPDPGATVCSCFGVGVNQIVAAVHGGCHSVEAVGEALNAGTNCGSCRAEIRGIVDGCLAAAAE